MKLLLDTHILLWTAENAPQLSQTARNMIDDQSNEVYFSVVSLWEIVIKTSLKRPGFDIDAIQLRTQLLKNDFTELLLESSHVFGVNNLQRRHKDPFDHIIVAQALVENLTLITSDTVVAAYDTRIICV